MPRAAAVHGGVSAAEDDNLALDGADVTEGDRGEPVDADVNERLGFLPTGQFQIAALRRAGTYEDRIEVRPSISCRAWRAWT